MKTLSIILIGTILMLSNQSCITLPSNSIDTIPERIQNSLQFREGKFRNDTDWVQASGFKGFRLIWDFFFAKGQRSPERVLPNHQVEISYFSDSATSTLNATWLGHSSLMINIDGYKVLTDPVFANSVTVFGPKRYNGNIPLDIEKIPNIDVVIISHNHFDHLNKYSIMQIKDKVGRFILPLGVGKYLVEWDIAPEKIIELDWDEGISISRNLSITATPSQHFSGRGLSDRNKSLWASWVIKSTNHKVFFSGDSGYFDGFKIIGENYGPFDMTFLECGAYNERWHNIHMYPEETIQAHIDLKGKILHPIHWGTFNLSLHPWFEPMERFSKEAEKKNIIITTPVVGETSVFGKELKRKKWWELIED